MLNIKLAPSIFAADVTVLREQICVLEQSNIQLLHIDVMDGNFVRRMAYGADHIRMIKKCTAIPLDVHMMVDRPERHLDDIIDAGADLITIHEEAGRRLYHCLQTIKRRGRRCAVALNPATNPKNIEYVMGLLDMVLVMTVNPGEGGQPFISEMLTKIEVLREMTRGRNIDIEVDGSIDAGNAGPCRKAGANVFVAGSYIFSGDIKKNIAALQRAVKMY